VILFFKNSRTFESCAKVSSRFEVFGVELSVLKVALQVGQDWNCRLVQNVGLFVVLPVTPAHNLQQKINFETNAFNQKDVQMKL